MQRFHFDSTTAKPIINCCKCYKLKYKNRQTIHKTINQVYLAHDSFLEYFTLVPFAKKKERTVRLSTSCSSILSHNAFDCLLAYSSHGCLWAVYLHQELVRETRTISNQRLITDSQQNVAEVRFNSSVWPRCANKAYSEKLD